MGGEEWTFHRDIRYVLLLRSMYTVHEPPYGFARVGEEYGIRYGFVIRPWSPIPMREKTTSRGREDSAPSTEYRFCYIDVIAAVTACHWVFEANRLQDARVLFPPSNVLHPFCKTEWSLTLKGTAVRQGHRRIFFSENCKDGQLSRETLPIKVITRFGILSPLASSYGLSTRYVLEVINVRPFRLKRARRGRGTRGLIRATY